jgi:hypothetical protein
MLRNIISQSRDVTLQVCQQRAKFEGWLKFELGAKMSTHTGFDQITYEDSYSTSGRSDISFQYQGEKWFVEMKTANTNWREEGLPNITRPVTRNMDGIADDILVLRRKSGSANGLAVFCIFPVPLRLWENSREQLDYHLRRIETTAELPDKILSHVVEYIEVAGKFGICSFIVEVV